MDTLKDVLIDAGQLDRYFEASVPINLWRSVRKTGPQKLRDINAVFDLYYEETTLSNGKVRRPDITVEERNGQKWVKCADRPRGASTFDKPGVFGSKNWDYYKIPAGISLPQGLAIVKDEENMLYGATHYTISPAWDMPLVTFRQLLNLLASQILAVAA